MTFGANGRPEERGSGDGAGSRGPGPGAWDFSQYSTSQPGAPQSGPTGGQGPSGSSPMPFPGGQAFPPAPAQSASPFGASAPSGGSPGAPWGTVGSAVAMDAGAAAAPAAGAAPTGLLVASLVTAFIGGVVGGALGGVPAIALAAWALAGPLTILLLALYQRADASRRAYALYSPPAWAPAMYTVAVILMLLAVVVCALQIALWVGRW